VLKLGGIASAAESWKERLQVDAERGECHDGGDEPVAAPYRGRFALLVHRFGLHVRREPSKHKPLRVNLVKSWSIDANDRLVLTERFESATLNSESRAVFDRQ
jgi:hypothetical protein